MVKLASLTLTGAVSGAIYGILASGLVVTYTTSGVFNFSLGAIAFATAFLYFQLNTGLHWPIVPAALVSIVVFAPLLGLLLDRLVFRALAWASIPARIVATVGLLVALPSTCLWTVERLNAFFPSLNLPVSEVIQVPPGIGPTPKDNWVITRGVVLDSNEVIIFVAAALSALGLWLVVRHTRLGLQMRATVDRVDLAAARGVDPGRTTAAAWMMGTFLAGLAGVVGAPILALNGGAFTLLMFVSATAAVLGGLQSIPLAFAGGLLLGVIQNWVAGYATFAQNINGFRTSVPFVLLFLGLFVLARSRARVASAASSDTPPPDHLADLPPWRRRAPWAAAAAALVFYTLVIASPFWSGLVALGLAMALVLLSFVVITGLGGMVSLAQAAFVTTGALSAGWMLSHHVPFVVAAVVGTVAAAVIGLIVALPALRLGGLPLALATLALGFLGDQILFQTNLLTNNRNGWLISRPALFGLHFTSQRTYAMLLLGLVGLVILLIHGLQRSSLGRAITAVRSSEAGALTSGISPTRVKLYVFGISAAIAGFGGVMLGTYTSTVSATDYTVIVGLTWLAVTVLFGVRRPGGAVIAGLVFALSPQILSYVTTSQLIPAMLFGFGAAAVARNPDGAVIDAGRRLADRRRRRGTPQTAPAASTTTTQAPEGLLSVHGLRAGYGDVEVLHGLDLGLHRGTVTALLGSNGAGKSTLCSALAGLVTPTAGTILLDTADITTESASGRARRGLVLSPEGRGVFPSLTVDENLALWLGSASEREQAYHRFALLADRRRQPAGFLSGGEQQLLSLAPLLVRPPDVLIVDEPTLGLAPLAVDAVLGVLGELRDRGTTILLVEEKAQHVLRLADQVVFLDLGRVAWSGPPADVDADRLARSYLGG